MSQAGIFRVCFSLNVACVCVCVFQEELVVLRCVFLLHEQEYLGHGVPNALLLSRQEGECQCIFSPNEQRFVCKRYMQTSWSVSHRVFASTFLAMIPSGPARPWRPMSFHDENFLGFCNTKKGKAPAVQAGRLVSMKSPLGGHLVALLCFNEARDMAPPQATYNILVSGHA